LLIDLQRGPGAQNLGLLESTCPTRRDVSQRLQTDIPFLFRRPLKPRATELVKVLSPRKIAAAGRPGARKGSESRPDPRVKQNARAQF
jgi:hypothetical protein